MTYKKKFEVILWLNGYFFYAIYSLALLFALLEVFSYKGFTQKYIFIPLPTIVTLTLISGFLFLISDKKDYCLYLLRKIFYLGHLLFAPFIFIFWLIVTIINAANYDNYIFTKIHITPDHLPLVVFLTIFFISVITLKKTMARTKFDFGQKAIFLIIFAFFSLSVNQNRQTVSYAVEELKWIVKYPQASYENKIGFRWGKDVYAFINFVRSETPQDATILIPPREDPWGIEGNDHVMRGFVYPRKTIRYYPGISLKKEKIEYILISSGFYSDPKLFPQFSLTAKEIILFSPDNMKKKVVEGNLYDYRDEIYVKAFGLIKLQ